MPEKVGAVLWQNDLRSYTQISESIAPEEIIPFLYDYADIVVSAIHGYAGDVLKLIGDGVLAIFAGKSRAAACLAAASSRSAAMPCAANPAPGALHARAGLRSGAVNLVVEARSEAPFS